MSRSTTTKSRRSRRLPTGARQVCMSVQRPGALHPLVMALAAVFVAPTAAQAQPVGHHVVAGQATVQQQGNNLLVTTQNAPGTQHSALNWQSFNVPAGTSTWFQQPNASSTSINRVTAPNPSTILGQLGSNGHLVLVNPAGIAVGAGAVAVDAGAVAVDAGAVAVGAGAVAVGAKNSGTAKNRIAAPMRNAPTKRIIDLDRPWRAPPYELAERSFFERHCDSWGLFSFSPAWGGILDLASDDAVPVLVPGRTFGFSGCFEECCVRDEAAVFFFFDFIRYFKKP